MVGERLGRPIASGCAIFFDYPILAGQRVAYPICAGYDRLANTPATAALVAIPGVATSAIVVDTHLHSNGASATPGAGDPGLSSPDRSMLSDHVGIAVRYRMATPRSRGRRAGDDRQPLTPAAGFSQT